ncbi:hypothetical protein HY640_02985 [Candidatus Woesearchaeota archaeon]|nr:hypothetical protein [Candidatus Woesearchaeota archaeon]
MKIENALLYGCLAVAITALVFTAYTFTATMHMLENKDTPASPVARSGKILFAEFDQKKVVGFMDSNHDGLCDLCGMRIEDCIAAGMLECTMDPNARIGLLGSQHAHADIKVYVGGEEVNLADPKYFVKSRFVHVENDGPGKSGNIVHVHSSGIRVGFLLESLGISSKDLKVYVNNEPQKAGLEYVIRDHDRILVTDSSDESRINSQIGSLTSFTSL